MTALSRPKNLTPKRNSFWDYKKHRKTSAERWTFSLAVTYFDIYNPSVTLRVPPSLTQGRHCRRSCCQRTKLCLNPSPLIFIFPFSIVNSNCRRSRYQRTRLRLKARSLIFNFQFLKILRNRVMDILAHFHNHTVVVAVKPALAV